MFELNLAPLFCFVVHFPPPPFSSFTHSFYEDYLEIDLADTTFSFPLYSGLGHSVSNEVLAKVTAFISRVQGKGKKAEHDEL